MVETHPPTRTLVVAERKDEADDVVSLVLRDPAGAPLPAWTAGAHVDLVVAPGVVRQYSLCGDPDDASSYRVAVLREPAGRGGSAAVHEKLHPGVEVEVSSPRNHFALRPAAAYVLVAGGIGITPLLAMAREAARAGVPWHLAYGGRTRTSMAFVDEARALPGGDVALVALDTDGLLPVADLVARAARDGADVYCCGPAGLLDAVIAEGGRVLGPERVHVERFTPVEVVPDGPERAFEVEVASLGLTVTVPPDRTTLEVLEDAGVQILSSCREGTCGTCELAVVDGAVDHRDSLLTPAEQAANDTMFPCVSRAAGARLVVDLL